MMRLTKTVKVKSQQFTHNSPHLGSITRPTQYALFMRRYALNHHAICPQYQAPEIIEKRDTQGIRRRMPCVSVPFDTPANQTTGSHHHEIAKYCLGQALMDHVMDRFVDR